MDHVDDRLLVIIYTVSNVIGALLLWAAIKKTRLTRLLLLLIFAWASWTNYRTAHLHPEFYQGYSQHAIGFYRDFINGWFKTHSMVMVSIIAVGQAMIAFGMLLRGMWVKIACIGAIIFLLAIAPLGFYAAFPFSVTVSLACYFILKKENKDYLWDGIVRRKAVK